MATLNRAFKNPVETKIESSIDAHIESPIDNKKKILQKTHDEIYSNSYVTALDPKRPKKERAIPASVTIWSREEKRIEKVMQFLCTNNRADAMRFMFEVMWEVCGRDIEKKINKRKNIPSQYYKTGIPAYYRFNFDKILDRVILKSVDDAVLEVLQEDAEAGYPGDKVIILDMEKIFGVAANIEYKGDKAHISPVAAINRAIESQDLLPDIETKFEVKEEGLEQVEEIDDSHFLDALLSPQEEVTNVKKVKSLNEVYGKKKT